MSLHRLKVFIACLIVSSLAQGQEYLSLTVNEFGLGPVRLGSEWKEASAMLGVDTEHQAFHYGDEACSSYAFGRSEDEWDIRVIVEFGKVAKIDIYAGSIATKEGIGVGNLMSEVTQMYAGRYSIAPAYEWPEKTIQVKLKTGAVLEFTGPKLNPGEWRHDPSRQPKEVVRRFSIGMPGVGSVEGCL